MAIIDLVEWNSGPEQLAWKCEFNGREQLSTSTQLIVNQSQEAFLCRGEVCDGPFGTGQHTLSTENIPLLTKIFKLLPDEKSFFKVEVWFFNTNAEQGFDWGTGPIQLKDPQYLVMVPARAFGHLCVRVVDSNRLLTKLLETRVDLSTMTLNDYFRGIFTPLIKTDIENTILSKGKSVIEIASESELSILSKTLNNNISVVTQDYGVEISYFEIKGIDLPEEDPTVKTFKATLAEVERLRRANRILEVGLVAAGPTGLTAGERAIVEISLALVSTQDELKRRPTLWGAS